MTEKLTKIMDVCNKWLQYHQSLRGNWKDIDYDDVTKMIVYPIIDIVQSSAPAGDVE